MRSLSLFSINCLAIIAVAGILFFCQSAESKKAPADSTPVPAKSTTPSNAPAAAPPKQQQQKLVVYYFHTTFRCRSCNMIEALTRQAVTTGFSRHLENGRVEFKSINIEEPGNEHFGEDYKLYTKSVILSEVKDGKEASWKNLEKVWTLLGDENKFIEYLQTEIKSLL